MSWCSGLDVLQSSLFVGSSPERVPLVMEQPVGPYTV